MKPIYKQHDIQAIKMSPIPQDNVVDVHQKHLEILQLEHARLTKQSDEVVSELEKECMRLQEAVYSAANFRKFTQARGEKVQRYSPDGKTLIKTYEGYMDASRDPDLDDPVANMIKNAVKMKKLYKGFRWAILPRESPYDTVQDIGETVEIKCVSSGLIAMIDPKTSKIIHVYKDQKEAADDDKYKETKVCHASMTKAVSKGTLCTGFLFKRWFECSEEDKKEYLDKGNELPQKRMRQGSKPVEAKNVLTNTITFFSSIADAKKALRMNHETIKSAIEKNVPHKGYMFKYADLKEDDNNDVCI